MTKHKYLALVIGITFFVFNSETNICFAKSSSYANILTNNFIGYKKSTYLFQNLYNQKASSVDLTLARSISLLNEREVLISNESGDFITETINENTNEYTNKETREISSTGSFRIIINNKKDRNKFKLIIKNPSGNEVWHTINMLNWYYNDIIWLTSGIGKYAITIVENTKSNIYTIRNKFILSNKNNIEPFIYPSGDVQSNSEEIMTLSNKITSKYIGDLEKSRAIYDWVTANISYDFDRFRTKDMYEYRHVFGAIETLNSLKGVCYDFATMLAALGRASNIKVKVVSGNLLYDNKVSYHAWNECYISDKDKWIRIDSSTAVTSKTYQFNNYDDRFEYVTLDER